jgi:hypothetical protein
MKLPAATGSKALDIEVIKEGIVKLYLSERGLCRKGKHNRGALFISV